MFSIFARLLFMRIHTMFWDLFSIGGHNPEMKISSAGPTIRFCIYLLLKSFVFLCHHPIDRSIAGSPIIFIEFGKQSFINFLNSRFSFRLLKTMSGVFFIGAVIMI